MKRFAKSLAVLFAAILAISVFAFAAETEEKTYIVYPKEEIALFSADEDAPEYMVIGEEELNMLLEEAPEMIDWYEENIKGELFDTDTVPYDSIYMEKTTVDNVVYEGYVKYELQVINAAKVWEKGYYGDGIKVAVIDSGIDTDHPEFAGRILDGKDYTTKDLLNKVKRKFLKFSA
ncbi:MAG: hypothetical protein E7441_12260 [Ruminococcaceae bacterium]|nr:hypothetical protein [Oscillospiraceae bacterium]